MSVKPPRSLQYLLGLVTLCCATAAAVHAAEHARSLTMEQIASAPFPSQLKAAPVGDTVAWVYDEQGARNVWVAELQNGHYRSRRLTAYRGDDGVEISDLTWSADAHTLFYTLGGDSGGRSPVNPTSAPQGGSAGEVWAASLDGSAPHRIGVGYAPEPSPSGDRVLFVRGGQPFIATAAAGSGEPKPLFHDEGRVGELTWSPDGSRVAFVSSRERHSVVGVFDVAKKQILWMSPGIDSDRQPTWSPDGTRLAFLRLAEGVNPAWAVSQPQAYPWEIWIADPATGQGQRRWAAQAGRGSRFRELFNSRGSLFWAAGEELVFPWEVTGWVRLYRIGVDGNAAPTLLTPGQAEIFGAELSGDRRTLVYSSNLGDLDRRHIWQLRTDGGEPRQLTFGQGIEDYPILTSHGRVLALRGEARVPLRPVLVEGGSMVDLAPEALPRDFPSADLVQTQLVSFPAADGLTVHGQLFIPKGRSKPGPALLFFHGGPTNRQMFAAWDSFETHTHLYEANQYLANHGYIVLSVNYRGGAGYGLAFREPKGFGAGGASELNDIVGAARYLQSRPDVDPKRLGVWGGSYGGRMTSLALAAAPEYFAAGADYAGVHDWLAMPEFTAPNEEAAKLARESGAMAHVDTWRAPVLLMHADADPIVPFAQTAELAAALRARGIPVDYLMIPNEVHFLLRHGSWNTIFDATRQYMDRHLKP